MTMADSEKLIEGRHFRTRVGSAAVSSHVPKTHTRYSIVYSGDVAQWQNVCLTCVRSWVLSPEKIKSNQIKINK
jgi:hypothetical protein